MHKNHITYILLSVLSGLLLTISFPFSGSLYPLAFIALVPLLLFQDNVLRTKTKSSLVFIFSLLSFLIYYVGTSYWLFFTLNERLKAVIAYILFAGMMAMVFWVYHLARKYLPLRLGNLSFFILWISFEFGHYHWDLSWPGMNLGNILSTAPELIQWYSVTGVLGGSLWILLINFMIFKIIQALLIQKKGLKTQYNYIIFTIGALLLPSVLSIWMYSNYKEIGKSIEVVITQPNIETYTDKSTDDEDELIELLSKVTIQAEELMTPNTKVVLAPETVLSIPMETDNYKNIKSFNFLQNHVNSWETVSLVAGAKTYKFFKQKLRNNMKFMESHNVYYEVYNDLMVLTKNSPPTFVHKTKLFPGVEKFPFTNQLPFLEEFAYNNKWFAGTLGTEPKVKSLRTKDFVFAPVICYESVYGDFIAEQCRKRAEVIFIITNDSWWGNTAGHKQHKIAARLRAIENRRYVARSANTGISCIVNQRGDVVQETNYGEYEGLRGDIILNKEMTFYTRYGDFLGKIAIALLVLLNVFTIFKQFVFTTKKI